MIINSVIFLIIWGFTFTVGQSEGETCTIERTNSDGICKLITKCPSVINDIRNRRSHTRCGFSGTTALVCCPTEIIVDSTDPGTRRLHEEKCKEYKSSVYKYVDLSGTFPDAERNRISIDKCGHKQNPLIVEVTLAKPREFPHMALIGFDAGNDEINWAYSGTLISDRYVLTAAHCLYLDLYGEPKYVRLGDLIFDSDKDDAQPENYYIEKIIPHPEWKRSSRYNDIGLLKLDRNVNLNPYRRPACLPTQFDVPEKLNIASGWVQKNWADSDSTHLQKVILEKFSLADCNDIYSSQINRKFTDGIRNNTQMCAGSSTDNKDICQGGSGGPLQVYHHSEYCMYTVIGITSFGITCGNVGGPGVYTRVFPFVDWIENTVWKN